MENINFQVFVPCENKLSKVSDNQGCCEVNCLKNGGTKCKNSNGIAKIIKEGEKVVYKSSTNDMGIFKI